MLKFLIDESSGIKLCKFLKNRNYDVKYVADFMLGASDRQVLELAKKEGRILVTNDKDFGELIFKLKSSSSGVILLRLRNDNSKARQKYLSYLLEHFRNKLKSNFTVVEESQIRFRKLT